jgi:hypothetical protein
MNTSSRKAHRATKMASREIVERIEKASLTPWLESACWMIMSRHPTTRHHS